MSESFAQLLEESFAKTEMRPGAMLTVQLLISRTNSSSLAHKLSQKVLYLNGSF
jgi:hypothetical protein